MTTTFMRRAALVGLLGLLAGCEAAKPTAPIVIPPLSSLVIAPRADTLALDASRQFTATALDTLGHPYTGALQWESSDAGVVTVSSSGLAHAVGEGSALVYVAGGGRRDSASVLVLPGTAGWLVQTSNAAERLNGVFFDANGRLGWVVGDAGVVLSTADAGASWGRSMPATADLWSVWFTSAGEGWVAGDAGTMLHTLDGGAHWTRITAVNTSEDLRHVHFATPDTGWVVGANGLVLSTFDHGASWQKTYLGGLTLNSVMFAGTRDGWAVGEGGIVIGTHDRGLTWFVVQPSVTGLALKSVWRRGAALAVAVGAAGVVPRTEVTPDSVAWVLGSAGSENQLEGVCFPADLTGYAVGWNGLTGIVRRSDDGGVTWRPQVANATFRLRAVFFVDGMRGWAVGEAGQIRHTSSGGE